ncbi:hypothetical protein GNI_114420 [Gregarina niphandrodes]|uniref:Uncharacterized protein n=1 Tax=Gregarina niphandrodes TaxID=110365 RepID=A0A023B333_GRENI|nr:hypothetical protein GNI_114420 [Gregarina niphandrodes]EZG55333.1 hypothetical protein GNI_114420 [Gregarina niphandrodes]|eukprot:XP_011131628.1 hypothetical protein GNI_114420 [Gregarina niphandrodes]
MLFVDGRAERVYTDGLRNEAYVFQIKRTDAVLKTRYITGSIFVITPITSVTAGLFQRAFVDVNDNRSVIFELAEGFADQPGRNMYFKSRVLQQSLVKMYPQRTFLSDALNLEGGWVRQDGSRVKIHDFHRLEGHGLCVAPGFAYWYNDETHAVPQVRLSTTLFLDETLPFEQHAFDTTSRFIQLGFYGDVSLGGDYIVIKSPADGRPIFSFRRVLEYATPTLPPPPPTVITVSGVNQVAAISEAAQGALPTTTTTTTTTTAEPTTEHHHHRDHTNQDDDHHHGHHHHHHYWPPPQSDLPYGPSDNPWPRPAFDNAPAQSLYELYPNYGLFNRGFGPNHTFPTPLEPPDAGGALPRPAWEIDPYAFDNDPFVGPPTSLQAAPASPGPATNRFDPRSGPGSPAFESSSPFHRALYREGSTALIADLAKHEHLRNDDLLFEGTERLKTMLGHSRRLAASQTAYPEPEDQVCLQPSDSWTGFHAVGRGGQGAKRQLSPWGTVFAKRIPVGIVSQDELDRDDEADNDENAATQRPLVERHLEGRPPEGRAPEGRVVPKTTLEDLKKFLPSQFTENPVVQVASKAIENRAAELSGAEPAEALFAKTQFFGLDLPSTSPYDWLWRASAGRLATAERYKDEALMRKMSRKSARRDARGQ